MPRGFPPSVAVAERRPVDTDRLVEDHERLVSHLIRRTVRDRTAHEELFQEVFLRVLESLPRFEGGSKLSTWIAAIAIHTCYKFIQRASTRERVESFGNWLERWPKPSVPSSLQEDLERRDVRQRLERHLEGLAPKYALPIALFYFEGMTYQEIDGLRQTAAALAALTLPSAPAAWTNAAKTRLRARSTAPVAAIPVRPAHARPRTAVLQYSAIAAGAVASLVLLVGLVTGGMVRGGDPHAARAVQLVTWVLSLHALVVVPLIIDDVYLLVRSGSRRRQRLE